MSALNTLIEDLSRLRDEARVQAHLGAMDARVAWDEMEAKWHHFATEAALEKSGENIKATLEALAEELRSAYQQIKNAV